MNGAGCTADGKAGLRISGPDKRIFGIIRYMTDIPFKKIIVYLAGGFTLVLGITLVLSFWADVVVLFRGVIGMVLALAGLLILYSLNRK